MKDINALMDEARQAAYEIHVYPVLGALKISSSFLSAFFVLFAVKFFHSFS